MTDKSARQRASATFHAKRLAAGWRKITVWLDPDSLDKLEAIRTQEGSLDKAIAYAVGMCPTREQVESAPYFETQDEWATWVLENGFKTNYSFK